MFDKVISGSKKVIDILNSLVTSSNQINANSTIEKTAFGEQSSNLLHPEIAWNFHYNIHPDIIKQTTTGSGSITQSNSQAVLETTATTSSSAKIETYDALRYIPGIGGIVRFTSVFTEGVVGSQQLTGLGDANDGFFFGYNGATFSILKIQNGTKQWIPQLNWSDMNIDDFNPSKGNVYQIKFQWLGYGEIKFYIEDRDTGKFELVHKLKYANENLVPSIFNPSLPLMSEVINTTNNTNIKLQTPSAMAGLEGEVPDRILSTSHGVSANNAAVTAEIPILSIKNNISFQSKTNRIRLETDSILYSTDGTKAVTFRVYKNGTITNASFSDVDVTTTPLQEDTAGTAISGARLLITAIEGKVESGFLPGSIDLILAPGETLTVTAESTNATEINVSMTVRTKI